MSDSQVLTPALEDYLEAIATLDAEQGRARVRDIAGRLSVHKSTVTAALHALSEKGLVNYSPYRSPTLTRTGEGIARKVADKHHVIRDFLTQVLLVDEDLAGENACRVEHVLDKEVLDRLSLFAEFVKECSRTGDGWLERFRRYSTGGDTRPGR